VTRALKFLALFAALFVVSARCTSGFPLTLVCAVSADFSVERLCPVSDEPREQDTLAEVVWDESDDGAEAVIAPPEHRIRVLTPADASAADGAAHSTDRASNSHARNLERPPRV